MTTYIGLLRGVNVGGNKKVAMADLRDLFAALKFRNPRTLLQSGNVVFECASRSATALEQLLQRETHARLRLETEFFVRTAAEWTTVVADNPFPAEATGDPGHLVVVSLRDAPAAKAVAALQKAITGRERVRAAGRHAYITYPDGIGTSRLTAAVIDKHLATRGTARNWNTVMKLAAMASS
jgi:uncharacterized protein (DUF1697 family)